MALMLVLSKFGQDLNEVCEDWRLTWENTIIPLNFSVFRGLKTNDRIRYKSIDKLIVLSEMGLVISYTENTLCFVAKFMDFNIF